MDDANQGLSFQVGGVQIHEFISTSYKLARHHPLERTVRENISPSFYPGVKIGVIGPNGAGESSLPPSGSWSSSAG